MVSLEKVIAKAKNTSNAVFNLLPPPYGSGLDEAPELTKDLRPAYAGRSLVPVGSKSVYTVIDKYQPLLGLHGHIHEGKGTRKYKKTLCINPGSMYEQGVLHGAVVELKPQKVGNYVLTTGRHATVKKEAAYLTKTGCIESLQTDSIEGYSICLPPAGAGRIY